MIIMRDYGPRCLVCKKFCQVGIIDIDDQASAPQLREKLRSLGWQGEWAACDDHRCSGKTFCDLDNVNFRRES